MEVCFIVIGIGMLLYLLITFIECIYGYHLIQDLSTQPNLAPAYLPPVTIILSALNEETEIEKALLSLIHLDYPQLEIIAINDRSTDATATILDRLKQAHSRLRVFHLEHLPEGWFGKNHALYFASNHAKGDWLLFTDADVTMKKNTLIKALSYALTKKIDHLTIHENHDPKNFWLKVLLLGYYMTYSIASKPWRIRYSWSKKSLGHGAFNLVNKKAYIQCKGHSAIALECLDDMKLGELIKVNGFQQDIVDGRDFVERNWYHSLTEMIKGLEKNSFAYYNYRLLPVIRDSILALLFYVGTLVFAYYSTGSLRWVNLMLISFTLLLSMYIAKKFRFQKRYAFFYPIAITLIIYMMWNSVISTYKNGGVVWRGTLYPLKMLREKKSIHS